MDTENVGVVAKYGTRAHCTTRPLPDVDEEKLITAIQQLWSVFAQQLEMMIEQRFEVIDG